MKKVDIAGVKTSSERERERAWKWLAIVGGARQLNY